MFIAPPPPVPGLDPETGALQPMPLAAVNTLNPTGSLAPTLAENEEATPIAATKPQPAFLQLEDDLTYYYSAVCPFCKRFTPELAAVLTQNPNLSLTCVDLTPHEVGPHTAPPELPCNWRLPQDNELESGNIRQTPTLLLKGPGGSPLRISGYVDKGRLQSYLNAAGLLE